MSKLISRIISKVEGRSDLEKSRLVICLIFTLSPNLITFSTISGHNCEFLNTVNDNLKPFLLANVVEGHPAIIKDLIRVSYIWRASALQDENIYNRKDYLNEKCTESIIWEIFFEENTANKLKETVKFLSNRNYTASGIVNLVDYLIMDNFQLVNEYFALDMESDDGVKSFLFENNLYLKDLEMVQDVIEFLEYERELTNWTTEIVSEELRRVIINDKVYASFFWFFVDLNYLIHGGELSDQIQEIISLNIKENRIVSVEYGSQIAFKNENNDEVFCVWDECVLLYFLNNYKKFKNEKLKIVYL